MAILFKSILRGEPGVPGGGVKKYYALTVTSGETSFLKLSKLISKATTVNKADVLAVLSSMVEFMILELEDSQIIRLGEFGSIRVSLHSEGVDTEEEVTSDCIENASIILVPGPEIKKMLKTLEYKKVEGKFV